MSPPSAAQPIPVPPWLGWLQGCPGGCPQQGWAKAAPPGAELVLLDHSWAGTVDIQGQE